MKASDYIKILEKLRDDNGDPEVFIRVSHGVRVAYTPEMGEIPAGIGRDLGTTKQKVICLV